MADPVDPLLKEFIKLPQEDAADAVNTAHTGVMSIIVCTVHKVLLIIVCIYYHVILTNL